MNIRIKNLFMKISQLSITDLKQINAGYRWQDGEESSNVDDRRSFSLSRAAWTLYYDVFGYPDL